MRNAEVTTSTLTEFRNNTWYATEKKWLHAFHLTRFGEFLFWFLRVVFNFYVPNIDAAKLKRNFKSVKFGWNIERESSADKREHKALKKLLLNKTSVKSGNVLFFV